LIQNQLLLNITKTNTVKLASVNSAHSHLIIEYKNTTIEEAASTKFLGFYIDNHIDFPVIFSISGMRECIVRINFINILLLIHFIQLQNF